jgi:hypothetical protein
MTTTRGKVEVLLSMLYGIGIGLNDTRYDIDGKIIRIRVPSINIQELNKGLSIADIDQNYVVIDDIGGHLNLIICNYEDTDTRAD